MALLRSSRIRVGNLATRSMSLKTRCNRRVKTSATILKPTSRVQCRTRPLTQTVKPPTLGSRRVPSRLASVLPKGSPRQLRHSQRMQPSLVKPVPRSPKTLLRMASRILRRLSNPPPLLVSKVATKSLQMPNRIRLNSLGVSPSTFYSVPAPDVRLKLAHKQPALVSKDVADQTLMLQRRPENLKVSSREDSRRLKRTRMHPLQKHSMRSRHEPVSNRQSYRKQQAVSSYYFGVRQIHCRTTLTTDRETLRQNQVTSRPPGCSGVLTSLLCVSMVENHHSHRVCAHGCQQQNQNARRRLQHQSLIHCLKTHDHGWLSVTQTQRKCKTVICRWVKHADAQIVVTILRQFQIENLAGQINSCLKRLSEASHSFGLGLTGRLNLRLFFHQAAGSSG